jgi:hypothetical protein
MLRSIAGAIWERIISDYIFRDAVDALSREYGFRAMLFGYNRSALSDMRVRWIRILRRSIHTCHEKATEESIARRNWYLFA